MMNTRINRNNKILDENKLTINVKNSSMPPQILLDNLLVAYKKNSNTEKLANDIIKKYPNHNLAWKILGAIKKKQGLKLDELKANIMAVKLLEYDFEALYNLAMTYKTLNKIDHSIDFLKKAIHFNPKYAKAYLSLGIIYFETNNFVFAERYFKISIEHNPNLVNARYNLGILYNKLKRFSEAQLEFKKVIDLNSCIPNVYLDLAIALQQLTKIEEAYKFLKKAICLKPDYAEVFQHLGNIEVVKGNMKSAQEYFEKAIFFKPSLAGSHRMLSSLKKYTSYNNHIIQMEQVCSNYNHSDEQRSEVYFALGKAYNDLKDYRKSFQSYKKGNQLKKKILNYNIKNERNLFEKLKETFCEYKNFDFKNKEIKDFHPIFIVGMPRSGTTLIEQIISAHSKVEGYGELEFAGKYGHDIALGATNINEKIIDDFRMKYFLKLNLSSNQVNIITDKMPQNFYYIGLLSVSFPNARFVHVKRNPASVCWSNYKQYFPHNEIGFNYDIDDIVNYFKLYKNLMQFWEKNIKNKIYELDYELLTKNHEFEIKKLLGFLKLNFEEKCLYPEKNSRKIFTASVVQVREKIYKGSSNDWINYKPYLDGKLSGI